MSEDAIEKEIQEKGLTAPRVTPERINEVISGEYYFTAADATKESPQLPGLELLTFCVLVLQNGFTVTGESSCASPENFDADLGRKIARQNAVNKIWPLEGYLLRQKLHESSAKAESEGESTEETEDFGNQYDAE
jgi:hypothetical protein